MFRYPGMKTLLTSESKTHCIAEIGEAYRTHERILAYSHIRTQDARR